MLFEDILPHDDVEGSGAELLGRMISAVEAIFETIAELRDSRTLTEWHSVLSRIVERFLGGEDEPKEVLQLRRSLERICIVASHVEAEKEIPFEVIHQYVSELFSESEQHGEFLRGGVTFCALKPMRSIPARVIWLMGMNDDAFPRKNQPLQFDLIARKPMLGDRSVRDDDRYIFLEAMISARDRLCISHVGKSLVDNEPIPPSVVVSELLEYIEQSLELPKEANIQQLLTVQHRLQAFSKAYFEQGKGLFSYSQANAAAARGIHSGAPSRQLLFAHEPLPELPSESRQVELESVIQFFCGPAEYFLKNRLGIYLREFDSGLDESEALELNSLAEYAVRVELLDPRLAGEELPPFGSFAARGIIPPGHLGDQHFRAIDGYAEWFYQRVQPYAGGEKKRVPIELELAPFNLIGTINSIYGDQLVCFRPTKIKVKDRLRTWIQHLAWCAQSGPKISVLVGEEEKPHLFEPIENAAEELGKLLDVYWHGMRMPLPFFPESSWEYAKDIANSKTPMEALEAASKKWESNPMSKGEGEYAANRLCFRESPFSAQFEELALVVFSPMLATVDTGKGRRK
jgi:exodeoxyribonuclease V gamma subunit